MTDGPALVGIMMENVETVVPDGVPEASVRAVFAMLTMPELMWWLSVISDELKRRADAQTELFGGQNEPSQN